MTHSAGYVDTKVILARKLLRDGASLKQMAIPLGYNSGSSVRAYLKRMGLPLPSIKGTRNRPTHSDEERQVRSLKMKQWHATHRLQEERGNREI